LALKITSKKFFQHLLVLVSLLIFFNAAVYPTLATELPSDVEAYINKHYPGANIRFDGLIELSDKTVYIPVLPVSYPESSGDLRILTQIPQDSERPDLIVFSNNLSLLRVIEKETGEKTLISGPEVPLKVKLGLLPQDLIVPEYLIVPPDLRSIVGDLSIPSQQANPFNIQNDASETQQQEAPVGDNSLIASESGLSNTEHGLQVRDDVIETDKDYVEPQNVPSLDTSGAFGIGNRYLYVTSVGGNILYVVDPKNANVVDKIKVGALPYKTVLSPDGSRLYVICLAANAVGSIDTRTNRLENLIKVGLRPTDIAVSPDGSKVFVANSGSGTISVINTDLFEVITNVDVKGIPDGVLASSDNRSFYMYNKASGIISQWDALNPENRSFLFVLKNPSKMITDPEEKRLYIVSRTSNTLMVYNLNKKEYDGAANMGDKPVDLDLSEDGTKLYILEAGEDRLSVLDNQTFEVISEIKLNTGGFPSSFNILPGTNKALVTNAESDKLTLVDLQMNKVITTIPIGITSKSLTFGPLPQAQQSNASKNSK
jgi:YVTN family beta-propeller protein